MKKGTRFKAIVIKDSVNTSQLSYLDVDWTENIVHKLIRITVNISNKSDVNL